MTKMRLDLVMLRRRLVESRSKAKGLIMAAQVFVDGTMIDKAGTMVLENCKIEIKHGSRYVSRGGIKLEAALKEWRVSVHNQVCADVGISTGGFTDCMLQHGASRVYGIDVGKGVVHWKLRQDERVRLLESTNARYLAKLPEEPSVVTIDVSFISIRLVIDKVREWLKDEGGYILALIKPQFEAGIKDVGKGGVVRSGKVHRRGVSSVLDYSIGIGLRPLGLIKRPLLGPAGNKEFLAYLSNISTEVSVEPQRLIDSIMEGTDDSSR